MHIVHMHVYVHALKYAQNLHEFTVFEFYRGFPNTCANSQTHRGVIFRARLRNAAMWENTSQCKQNFTRQALVPRPESRAALLTSLWEKERRRGSKGERAVRWDQTGHDERNRKLDESKNQARARRKENIRRALQGWLKIRVLREVA